MYLVEEDETSSTTTDDNEDVETVKTAAEIGKHLDNMSSTYLATYLLTYLGHN